MDVAGHGFAVLARDAADEWRRLADDAGAALGVPVAVEEVHDDGLDGAVLVRPDGVIAWRAQAPTADLQSALARVLDRVGG